MLRGIGKVAAISLPRRPRPCAVSWSTEPGIAVARSVAGATGGVQIDLESILVEPPSDDLLALDEALESLARDDPVGAELVRLRAFAGLTLGEAAEVLGIGSRTADRYWAYACAWLYDALTGDSDSTA